MQQEETKYRTLAENSPDIIARFDKKLRFLFVNSAVKEISGVFPKDYVGKTNEETGLPKELAESWNQALQKVIQTGKVQKGEFVFSGLIEHRIYQYVIVPEFSMKSGDVETVLSLIKDITESKKLADALAESEQKYRTIVETAAEGIVIAKPEGTHIFVNNRLAQMFGYSTDELLKKSSFDLMSEEEQKRQVSQMRKGLEHEQIQYREFEFRRKDGSILWAACNASPLFNENGKHVSNIALFSDITERKKADEALRKSEEEYSSLFSNMIDGFAYCQMIFDEKAKPVDFVYLQINDAFEKITGLKRDLVIGKKVTQAIPGIKEANPELFEIYGRVALTGQKEKFEVFFKPLNLWLSISVYSPRKGYFAAVFEDITDRMKMEQALSKSLEESYRRGSEVSALLSASQAVLQNRDFQDSARAIFDRAKELIGATAGYIALLSKDGKENEVLFLDSGGLPCTVDPSLPMPIRGLRAKAYESGKVAVENDFTKSEWKKFMPKGHVKLKNVLFAPLKIEQGVVGVIGLANKEGGFTERDAQMAEGFGEIASVALANSRMLEKLEENEKELKTYSGHLESLVEERTKQLKDSERLAAIGTVAGMVGHDIRNPLQAISGDVYLAKTDLASTPESEEKKNVQVSLMEIEKNAEYINKIVADLQDFAKPLTPKIEQMDLQKIVNAALATISIPENVTATCSLQKDFPKIKADPTYLQRILINLSNNGIQAMSKGGKLTISATSKNGKATIVVQDTGEGIPEKVKSKIFTPLMTTKAKGQGFGLAAVKRFTEAMGGTITFESEVGKGTKFIIELST